MGGALFLTQRKLICKPVHKNNSTSSSTVEPTLL